MQYSTSDHYPKNFISEICTIFENKISILDYPESNGTNYYFDILMALHSGNMKVNFTQQPNGTIPFHSYTYAPFYAVETVCPNFDYKRCEFNLLSDNFQMILNFNIDNYYDDFVVGKFAKHDGLLFKENNISYTSNDPCFNSSAFVTLHGFATKIKYESTFCCSHFQKSIPTSLEPTTIEVKISDSTELEARTSTEMQLKMTSPKMSKSTMSTKLFNNSSVKLFTLQTLILLSFLLLQV